MFNIIAACDIKEGIADQNDRIPWSNTTEGHNDMKEFRRQTIGCVVIMGRKTYDSIGKPLQGRVNIVITRDANNIGHVYKDSIHVVHDFDSALNLAISLQSDDTVDTDSGKSIQSIRGKVKIWVIGGAEIYAIAIAHPQLHHVHITRINADWGCSVFMPKIGLPLVREYHIGVIDIEIYGNRDEDNYLKLLGSLLHAPLRPNRTGIPTRGLFAEKLEFSLTRGDICILPLLTTKKVPVRLVIAELLWFISGRCTNISKLHENKCHIWDGNTTREFLDSRGLSDYSEGECGPIYGYQWRNWNSPYTPDIHDNPGIDQLASVLNTLRADPFDRRMIVSAWNPEQLDQMALPPCHWSFQFHCEPIVNSAPINSTPGTPVTSDNSTINNHRYSLNCLLNMRSADMALGVPFNIASYSLLTHMVARCVNMRPGRIVIMMADCHMYENHTMGVREQIYRASGQFPTVSFSSDIVAGGEIDQFTSIDQIIVGNYQPQGVIKYPMAV